MKIVFVDAKTVGTDIDLSFLNDLGEVELWPNSTEEEALERTKDADVVITNKMAIHEGTIGKASHLKLVCESATGTDNIDKDYLAGRNIAWRNVAGYSTNSVAQHTFSMLFYLLGKLRHYDDYVKNEDYIASNSFSYFDNPFHEIDGMTWGIIGLGAIGRKVAEIAKAFGANVIYASASGAKPQKGYDQVDLDTLYSRADIISIHAPLNEHTRNLINKDSLSKMKKNCILINVGRGPIVNEADLYEALTNDTIAACGLDVLSKEPMTADNPLRLIKDSDKLFITPHSAWATVEARKRLMEIVHDQIKEFFA